VIAPLGPTAGVNVRVVGIDVSSDESLNQAFPPDVRKAMQSIVDRSAGIVEEWIRLAETPAPSKKEQVRAKYIRAEMEKLGLADIRTDDFSNVSGVRKGTGGGPTVAVAAQAACRCGS